MILYFSGTGNSRWVARRLAELTNDTSCDLAARLRQGMPPAAEEAGNRIGIVFPVHGWYVPQPVLHCLPFLQNYERCYRYAVCTCGDDAGKAMSRLSRHFPLDAAWSVAMPNTYIPMFSLDSDALCREKIVAARRRLPLIARNVLKGQSVWDVHEGRAAWLKTYVIHPLFTHFCMSPKGFWTGKGCTGCGVCTRLCSQGNIRLAEGRPVWGAGCIHCMACVHGCPESVIQYNKVTCDKGRYRLSRYL